ncbi:MAG: hypothetical protein NZ888_07345 [Candidatus Nitrosocaldus sp.]|nr:hypothetical protein [Candidatus Nitrosocaldus sp.]MDW8000672.1 hypothetical protein [Candidatus Nitrosocaldus sp.]
MDLYYLDQLASKIKTNRDRIARLRQELAELDSRMRDKAMEMEFARIIGYEYDDEDAESMKARLNSEIDALEEAVKNDMEAFINGLISQDLVIPIEPRPVEDGSGRGRGRLVYRYRDGATFTNFVAMLSTLLPKANIRDLSFMQDGIAIDAKDEREAKYKFVNSIREMQRILGRKVSVIASLQ